jgi:hypothetical protein
LYFYYNSKGEVVVVTRIIQKGKAGKVTEEVIAKRKQPQETTPKPVEVTQNNTNNEYKAKIARLGIEIR